MIQFMRKEENSNKIGQVKLDENYHLELKIEVQVSSKNC